MHTSSELEERERERERKKERERERDREKEKKRKRRRGATQKHCLCFVCASVRNFRFLENIGRLEMHLPVLIH